MEKYGDVILETIESTVRNFYKTSSSSNESTDSAKKRRAAPSNIPAANLDEASGDYMNSTGRSKKRATRDPDGFDVRDSMELIEDDDLVEFADAIDCMEDNTSPGLKQPAPNVGGRVLPSWSQPLP